jgi:hypothetical protein
VAYELHGLIGRTEPIAHAGVEVGLVPTTLPQGFAWIPGATADGEVPDVSETSAVRGLTLDLEWAALAASRVGPVAYVEVRSEGERQSRAAVVWVDGQLGFGPSTAVGDVDRALSPDRDPVAHALRLLGVRGAPGTDEVDALGIGRHRAVDAGQVTPPWGGAALRPEGSGTTAAGSSSG